MVSFFVLLYQYPTCPMSHELMKYDLEIRGVTFVSSVSGNVDVVKEW